MTTKAQKAAHTAKVAALKQHLQDLGGNPNPETLSRSYGLPQPEVEAMIRSYCNGN